ADVTCPDHWDRLFEAVLARTDRLDILVNNAGAGIRIAPIVEQTDSDIQASIAVNLTGALFGCRRAAEVMRPQGRGIIVNISSVCAIHAWPGFGPYSAAKAGLNMFGHCLYTELREAGVRVTTITPSWGATEFRVAAGIAGGPTDTPEIRAKSMQPNELGDIVVQVCTLPAHLVLPDITVQPLVQKIEPM
ncbi:MAG: SDR family oxidoreductase, partial [Kiritimatiellaeota bacterium]|nr:SDR family oxidoreductase [Kiritimatiellota bacterium]